jgi:hypothetical protein
VPRARCRPAGAGAVRPADRRPRRPLGHQARAVPRAVANYIAKYVTKAVGIPGMPATRVRHPADIPTLRCSAHHKKMIATALQLGFGRYAHQFGYGGHPLTKSRRYSVTFGHIRRERAEYRKAQRWPDGRTRPLGPTPRRARGPGALRLELCRYRLYGFGCSPSGAHVR